MRRRQDPRLAEFRIKIQPDFRKKFYAAAALRDRDSNPELGVEAAASVHRLRPGVRRVGEARKRLGMFFRRSRDRQEANDGGLRVTLRRSREFESLKRIDLLFHL